jgi:AraC family transcriptional regulator
MQVNEFSREYQQRINRVLDFIEKNIAQDLNLNDIAAVAHFSPYHFHRIFKAMTGESLNRFIQRVRVEKAAQLLLGKKSASITEIALDCGYSGSDAFARAFREAFGMSATQWRKNVHEKSKNRQAGGNGRQASDSSLWYIDYVKQQWRIEMKTERTMDVNVRVEPQPEMTVAYVRHIGPYAGDEALFGRLFGRLFQWAGAHGVLSNPDLKVLTIYHDDPDITEPEKLRISVCVTVPKDTAVEGDIGKMNIPAGLYAMGHFEISTDQYGQAWKTMCGDWLPQSGYEPGDGFPYELMLNDPAKDPEGKHIIEICLPVKAI